MTRQRRVSSLADRKNTILIVDDEASQRKLLGGYLLSVGYDVVEAASAEEMLQTLARAAPDLILLDLELPGTDTLHLLELLLATLEGGCARIIATSAEPLDRRILCPEQVASHLQKPFAASALVRHVREALGTL